LPKIATPRRLAYVNSDSAMVLGNFAAKQLLGSNWPGGQTVAVSRHHRFRTLSPHGTPPASDVNPHLTSSLTSTLHHINPSNSIINNTNRIDHKIHLNPQTHQIIKITNPTTSVHQIARIASITTHNPPKWHPHPQPSHQQCAPGP